MALIDSIQIKVDKMLSVVQKDRSKCWGERNQTNCACFTNVAVACLISTPIKLIVAQAAMTNSSHQYNLGFVSHVLLVLKLANVHLATSTLLRFSFCNATLLLRLRLLSTLLQSVWVPKTEMLGNAARPGLIKNLQGSVVVWTGKKLSCFGKNYAVAPIHFLIGCYHSCGECKTLYKLTVCNSSTSCS